MLKMTVVVVLLMMSFSSFAKEFCATAIRVNIPNSQKVTVSELKHTQEIYKIIRSKGYVEAESTEVFLSFQHGSYEKKGTVMGMEFSNTYIMTRITVKDADGAILFQSDRDRRIADKRDLAVEKIQLMEKHITVLPKCSKLPKTNAFN